MANRPTVGRRPDLAQLRSELISSNEGIVQAKWSPGPTPSEGATGDVVWSATQQKGFMRFRGLPVNTPTREQYQLWIFAKNQSDKTPIDGGVFDITSTSETIVPINAKLLVEDAYMFAVTIEKPGGVVVSSRKRLPLLAKVD
jgi:anti-sigma-K factor RskA